MSLKEEVHIAVNCRFLTQPLTGVQRFAIEICKALKKFDHRFIFISPTNVVHHEVAKELEVITIGNRKGYLWEQVDLRNYVTQKGMLLLSLGNTAPLFLHKQLITIHDMSVIRYPEWFSLGFRTFYKFLLPRIAKKARHIFTVSEASKSEISDLLNIPKDKVSVIYNAVSSVFEDVDKQEHQPSKNKRYILSVSSLHPRKNFKRLVDAFLQIDDPDIQLYLVGNVYGIYKEEHWESSKRVVIKQNVNDQELKRLYQNASLFVYPSLYEGFGLPIIEAAVSGAPLCVSDIPVFKEVCEGQAIYFDPKNTQDICQKISTALQEPVPVDSSFFKHKYSWEKSAITMYSRIMKEIDNF